MPFLLCSLWLEDCILYLWACTLWMKFESNFTKGRKYALAKESGLGNGDFRVFSEQYALLSGGENMHFLLLLILPTGINL